MNREFRSYLPAIAKFALFVLALCAVIIIAALTIEWAKNTEEEGVQVQEEELASIEGDSQNSQDQNQADNQENNQDEAGPTGSTPATLPALESAPEPVATPEPQASAPAATASNDPDGDGLPNTGIEDFALPIAIMTTAGMVHFYVISRKEFTSSLIGNKTTK